MAGISKTTGIVKEVLKNIQTTKCFERTLQKVGYFS